MCSNRTPPRGRRHRRRAAPVRTGNEATPVDFGDVCINFGHRLVLESGIRPPRPGVLGGAGYRRPPRRREPPSSSRSGVPDGDGGRVRRGRLDGLLGAPRRQRRGGRRRLDGGLLRALQRSQATDPSRSSSAASGHPPRSSSPTPVDEAPTDVVTETCFRQVEFAGVLRGTDAPTRRAVSSTSWSARVPVGDRPQPVRLSGARRGQASRRVHRPRSSPTTRTLDQRRSTSTASPGSRHGRVVLGEVARPRREVPAEHAHFGLVRRHFGGAATPFGEPAPTVVRAGAGGCASRRPRRVLCLAVGHGARRRGLGATALWGLGDPVTLGGRLVHVVAGRPLRR